MYLEHLTDDERERLYYQAGLTEVAGLYARAADAETAAEELREAADELYSEADYNEVVEVSENRKAILEKAAADRDTLWNQIEGAKKLDRAAILTALAAIDLEVP